MVLITEINMKCAAYGCGNTVHEHESMIITTSGDYVCSNICKGIWEKDQIAISSKATLTLKAKITYPKGD